MSVAGIATSVLSHLGLQNSQLQSSQLQTQQQQIQSEFQQLAQDLQAGNLTQAQSAFGALQQSAPGASSSSNSTLSQEFNAVGSDLQSGNLSAAQQDFAQLQQTVQQSSQSGQTGDVHHHHHHRGGGGGSSASSTQNNSLSQLLNTLGQDLQSGSLTQAQQAYSQLTQSLQLLGGSGFSVSGTTAPASAFSASI